MIGWITSCFISHSRFISNPFGLDGHLISEKIVFEILKITPKSSNKTSIKLDEILRNRRHKKIVENIIKKKRGRRGTTLESPKYQYSSLADGQNNKIENEQLRRTWTARWDRWLATRRRIWREAATFRPTNPPSTCFFFIFTVPTTLERPSASGTEYRNLRIQFSFFFFSKIIKSGEESTWPQWTFWTIFYFFQ